MHHFREQYILSTSNSVDTYQLNIYDTAFSMSLELCLSIISYFTPNKTVNQNNN